MDDEKRAAGSNIAPRLVIHGGAGNIVRHGYPVDKYQEYRAALLRIISNTHAYMTSTIIDDKDADPRHGSCTSGRRRPSALQVATHAVVQLEDDALFNSGHGAVFTRDGINELEASVMVSRGFKKRGVGVMGLRRVRNPILLARRMLEHGEQDLVGGKEEAAEHNDIDCRRCCRRRRHCHVSGDSGCLNVPSAQGHTQIYGEAAEQLARQYGCQMVEPSYFFTQQRWDEHVRGLDKARGGRWQGSTAAATADEYLPQGTCGAVALDEYGVVCAATSTGGMTNKLTGRIGDTPVPGAGFWAEEWTEEGGEEGPVPRRSGPAPWWDTLLSSMTKSAATSAPIELAGSLRGFLADCLPTPFMYLPVLNHVPNNHHNEKSSSGGGGGGRNDGGAGRPTQMMTTRSFGASGTGNGDSFLRIDAVRTVAAMARWKPEPSARALRRVTGVGGMLQQSAGDRWGVAGEGEGGMVGIEGIVRRGRVVTSDAETEAEGDAEVARGEILMSYNCGGMYRAWIDDHGKPVMSIWSNTSSDEMPDGDEFE